MRHGEIHRGARIGWLRAAVLGANDGLISTSSLVAGVAAAEPGRPAVLLTAVAGLVAGALSMAAGEYVSVSSQADTENADLARETIELRDSPGSERDELADIYVKRGLERNLATEVAKQLSDHDALGAHAREELGIQDMSRARPIQAAITSAACFAIGAAPPICLVVWMPDGFLTIGIIGCGLTILYALGGFAAFLGGAPIKKAAFRVALFGAVAMGATALVGRIFGSVG